MSNIIQVTVSGAVGKQVFATGGAAPAIIKSVLLTPSGANARVIIREGNASGAIIYHASAPSALGSFEGEIPERGYKISKGVHVKVLGTNAQAYLVLD